LEGLCQPVTVIALEFHLDLFGFLYCFWYIR